MKIHPHDLLIEELFASSGDEYQGVLEHVLGCDACLQRSRALLHAPLEPFAQKVVRMDSWAEGPADYSGLLERGADFARRLQTAYDYERSEAVSLLAELLEHPGGRRQWIVRNHPRFQTWGLFEQLLERSHEHNFDDPAAGEGLALLALEITDRLEGFSADRLEDFRARSWASVANARRVRFDLRGSEEAFAIAFSHLARGTGEPMERAVLLDLKASLLRAQRRFADSLRLLARAIRIFRQLGERHRAGRSLVNMSIVHFFAGESKQAIPLLYEALDLIDASREPRLLLAAWNNLIDDLADSEQYMEAHKLLVRARPLYRQFPQPWVQNRRRWVEGRIARGLGQDRDAEVLFLRARDGFLAEDAAYDTALVSLDLAALYAEQGRTAEVKRIAEEMVPIFSSRQIHREALAALAFWKQAVDAERAGAELVSGVAAFLKRARHDPDLRFQEPQAE
ncbi:MAG TPA: tetratricopeptide repeat protein [Thermoanaerobaculia bacterium]|nr:tetratricopeptide repeat protein [Thermoanaerobaculia bacterium]